MLPSLLFLGIALSGCTQPDETTCPPPVEKAMVHIETYDWYINGLDESKIIFEYWITNYGKVEANDIMVNCNVINEDDETIWTSTHVYGNLASKTINFHEATIQKPENMNETEYYSVLCYVESCTDCDILYKRIPSLIEAYGHQ